MTTGPLARDEAAVAGVAVETGVAAETGEAVAVVVVIIIATVIEVKQTKIGVQKLKNGD